MRGQGSKIVGGRTVQTIQRLLDVGLHALFEEEQEGTGTGAVNEVGKELRGLVREVRVWQIVWISFKVGQCTAEGPGGKQSLCQIIKWREFNIGKYL